MVLIFSMNKINTIDWFIKRIGKRVYRDANIPPCGCPSCNEIEKNGIVITDEQQATYMYNIQMEFANDGHYLNYRDTK